jgi:uncharacterized protein with HEPN domain
MTSKAPKLLLDALGAIDLRNRIIHGYDAVDDEIVFLTATEDLGTLQHALEQLMERLHSAG